MDNSGGAGVGAGASAGAGCGVVDANADQGGGDGSFVADFTHLIPPAPASGAAPGLMAMPTLAEQPAIIAAAATADPAALVTTQRSRSRSF